MTELKVLPIVIKKQKPKEDPPPATTIADRQYVISQIKQKLEDVLKLMVEDAKDVQISITQGERTTIFVISCGKQNIAKIMGRNGKTIDALRTVVMAIAGRHGFRAIVEIPFFRED